MKSNKNNSGFTLVELLVVISIISFLSTIVFATMQEVRASAFDARKRIEFNQIKLALETFYNDHGAYPQCPQGGSPTTNNLCCISVNAGDCYYKGQNIEQPTPHIIDIDDVLLDSGTGQPIYPASYNKDKVIKVAQSPAAPVAREQRGIIYLACRYPHEIIVDGIKYCKPGTTKNHANIMLPLSRGLYNSSVDGKYYIDGYDPTCAGSGSCVIYSNNNPGH